MSFDKDLAKIEKALGIAKQCVSKYTPGRIASQLKDGGDPVTEADIELDKVLRDALVEPNDGWLSEETVDDLGRLQKQRVWIVDPIDGTREFIEGVDQWCISIGLAVDGKVVAAGICNPAADQLFLGSMDRGVTLNGKPAGVSKKEDLKGAKVLASRSEIKRGQWDEFMQTDIEVIPIGSVAYKLACVSAGLADATFTLVPKNEWDIAAGVLLVEAGGGKVLDKDGNTLSFNKKQTLLSGLIASGKHLFVRLDDLISTTTKQ